MKQTKLFSDTRPLQQPEGTYPYGKNGIQNDLDNSVYNEPGFTKMAAVCPYKYNGIIETDDKPVLFSTDNINSAIGFFNPETGLYEAIIDDNPGNLVNWPANDSRLQFSTAFYITGEAQRNYKGELVITFTDKRTEPNFPMYLNCDNPSINSRDDLRLFPHFSMPTIAVSEILGGRVPAGAYYVAIGYERNDGTSTAYSAVSNVTIARSGEIAGSADKALEINITNVDTNYDSVRIAIISKVNGVTKAVELLDFYPVSSNMTITYTGDNLSRDIDVTEVLVSPAVYSKVGTMGQLNDALYVGDLETEPDLNDMQPYALCINIEWKSELINAIGPPQEHINGTKKSFMHEEVYAFYVRYKKTRGGFTKWFITAGETPLTADLANSTEATAGGGSAVPKFKVEDTIHHYNAINKTGACGVYKNDTELYPDTVDFDASIIGGRNLRNQPVLHHKMPTLRWCKQYLYNSDATYGKTHLDLLGINAVNVKIPAKYTDVINGYEIGYAVRTVGNMTVYGQSLLLHGARNNFAVTPIFTSGGNFRTSIWHKGDNSFDNNNELSILRKDTFRFHAFDLLFNRPSITPTYISGQLLLRKNALRTEGYLEDGAINGPQDAPTVHLIDYAKGETPGQLPAGKLLRKITSSQYLSDNTNVNDFVNSRHENCFAGIMAGTDWPLNYGDAGFRVKGQSYTEPAIGSPGFEETYLVNLIAVKTNLYSNFYSQLLTSAGTAIGLTDGTTFWGGDTYISSYGFNTYGRHETNDGWGEGYKGKKVMRRFICESVSNINLRYEIPGNIYSKWYPHNPVSGADPNQCFITYFDRSIDPNQFGYTKDFNALNNLISSVIFSPYREEITKFPYRVHRGGKNNRQNKPRSWRTFLPLDYYECQKNMGALINILGMDDTLLIHHENALFRTQDKATLEAGLLSVTLGSGDIFRFEPQEASSAKLGYAGTQHDLGCVQTPIGYTFGDAAQGEIYLYKGQLVNLNPGLNNFLRIFMRALTGRNNFIGNGLTIGWDQMHKRILVTVKNYEVPASPVVKPFKDTAEFWADLTIGDIILYKNRHIEYVGINDTEFSCDENPIDYVINWEKKDPYCLLDSAGANTGMQAWENRIRVTDGIPDGYEEPNSPTSGIGTYFPPEQNLIACPLPAPGETWVGGDGYCELSLGSCAPGSTLSADGTLCITQETSAPTIITSDICVAPAQEYGQYSSAGTRVYATGYTNRLVGPSTLLTNNYWKEQPSSITGPMNRVGIWIDSDCDGTIDALTVGQILEFSYKMTLAAAETIYIGIGGDNTFRVDINGAIIVECDTTTPAGGGGASDNFNYWHVFPVTLQAGMNYINFKFVGDGSTVDAAGVMVYRNTENELLTATADSNLDILFRSTDLIGHKIDIATCPGGWILDTHEGSGNYVCRRTVTSPPIPSNYTNTGRYIFTTRCKLLNGIPTGVCEPNSAGANYISPETNSSRCRRIVTGAKCGDTIEDTTNLTTAYVYPEKPIDITSGTVTIQYGSNERPTKFTILKDGIELLTSGWIGIANYPGDWGTTLSYIPTIKELTFTIEPGHAYSIKVETGAADPDNIFSNMYFYTVKCT